MNYRNFSAYADFLLNHFVEDLTKKNIAKAQEVQLPVMKVFRDYSEKQLFDLFYGVIREFLFSVSQGKGEEFVFSTLDKWRRGQLNYLERQDLQAIDILLGHSIRKQLLIDFLDKYTNEIQTYKILVKEIEAFYSEILKNSLELYFDVQKEVSHQEKDFINTILDSAVISVVALRAVRDKNKKIVDFKYVLLNEKAEEMLQRKKEALIESTVLSEFPTIISEGIFEKYIDAVENEKVIQLNFKYTFEGFNTWFRQTLTKWQDGLVVFTEDISKDIEKENKILEKNNELIIARLAIEKSHTSLEIAVKERTKELSLINDLNKNIAGELDLKKIIQAVTDETTKLTKAQFGAFFYNIQDEKGKMLTLYTVSGVPIEHFSKFPIPRNTEVFDPTFSARQIVRSNDITKDPRYGKNPPYKGMPEGHLPVRSYLAVPVISRTEEVLGGLFYGHSEEAVFTEETERLVTSITSHAAIAIDNAKLFSAQKASEEKFRAMADNIPNLAWMANAKGWIFWYNKKWYKYTGTTPEQMEGWGWQSVHHPDELPKVMERWLSSIQTGEIFEMVFPLKGADGNFRPFLTRVVPVKDEKGNITQWFGTNTDIYHQEKLIRELKKTNNDLDNFIYTASHDLKSPISNIEGLITALPEVVGEEALERPEFHHIMDLIKKSVERFKNTILDLTEISRAQRDNSDEENEVNICEVIEDIKASLSQEIEASLATINLNLDTCNTIHFSKKNFRSIIYNLFTNAIKYRSPERAPIINVKTVKSGDYILLTVEDNGLGIEQGKTNQIFGMFKRLHSHVDGSGIGLYIVKRIVENNEGKIELESELGKGTTFKVYFKVK